MNLGTFVVLLILLAVVGWVIYGMVRDKKQGKSSCSHGCQNCAMHGQCHNIPQKKE
ncbi:MAG: FeoB-associated Cys-rich membrane protein [Ruminococcus sp.]|nr:FeoB-associated Cys-rich membrane protein [Ruminococcus sp.]